MREAPSTPEPSELEIEETCVCGAMVTLRYRLPAAPWSTNQDRNLHHMTRHTVVSLWKAGTFFAYRQQVGVVELAPSIVQITIPFKDRRKRDPHNYCGTVLKAVIDGLVEAGAWPDDTPTHVGHREPILVKDPDGEVVVEITPMSDLRKSQEEQEHG